MARIPISLESLLDIVFIWSSQVSLELMMTPKNLVLVTTVIFELSINISIVKFSLQNEWLDWKCIKLVLLILRDSLFNLNQEDILMNSVLIIDTSVLRFLRL